MLALHNDAFEVRLWEASTGKFTTVTSAAGKTVDDAAELRWTGDSAKLILQLHAADWRDRAHARFVAETVGPVIYHSSTEPFLAWIDVRRLALEDSVASYEVASGRVTEIAPPALIASSNVAEDGSFVILNHDIVKKTDYDTLGAGEARIDLLATGAAPRTLIPSTKGMTLIWSRDLHSYAYTKDGAIYFATIHDKEARLIAGKKKDDTPKDPDAKPKKESYTAVRLSAKGDRLIASSKEGLWLIDTAAGKKDLFVKMPEEDKLGPHYQVLEWSPSGDAIYLSYASRTTWERGVSRYDIASKRMDSLVKDGTDLRRPSAFPGRHALDLFSVRWQPSSAGCSPPTPLSKASAG